MTRPLIREHNTQTDEVIDREMTDAEYEQHLKDLALAQEKKKAEAEAIAKRAAALAKLEALGLSTDDLKALGL